MIVVDSSFALQWVLPEPDSEPAEQLLGRTDLTAPDILIIEVANVLAKKVRIGDLTLAEAHAGLQIIKDAIPVLVNSVALAASSIALAAELSHPVYDCCFLACAIDLDTKLATRDQPFIYRIVRAGLAARLWSSPRENA